MIPLGFYQLAAWIASIALVAGLTLLVVRWPLGFRPSFSEHAAQHRTASVYYALVFFVTLPIFAWVTVYYLTPKYSLPAIAGALMLTAVMFQLLCSLFPESGSEQRIFVHQLLAGISALAFMGFLGSTLTVLTSTQQPLYGVTIAVLIVMTLIALQVPFSSSPVRRYPLLAQSIFYGLFLLSYLALVVS